MNDMVSGAVQMNRSDVISRHLWSSTEPECPQGDVRNVADLVVGAADPAPEVVRIVFRSAIETFPGAVATHNCHPLSLRP